MSDILIAGFGVVGHNMHKQLKALQPHVYDRESDYLRYYLKDKYDVVFICVDTPLTEDNDLDITEVKNVLYQHNADIYVIKSTCPVGTVDSLKKESGKHIIYSPEYYGGTQHCNNYQFDFTILGGDRDDCVQIQQLLQNCFDSRHSFRIVDAKTAELVKFMENSWLATKVSFCAQFYEICQNHRLNYEELRELFILDPRVNPAHTFIYNDHPYWESHCLDKDVPHIAYSEDAKLLKDMIEFNNLQKFRE